MNALLVLAMVLALSTSATTSKPEKVLALVADPTFEKMVVYLKKELPVKVLKLSELDSSICSYSRLLILGPESFLKVKGIRCPLQKRYLAGILYPSLFEAEKFSSAIISPLPGCSVLKHYGNSWVTFYSKYLDYYVSYLSKCLELRAYRFDSLYELTAILSRVRKDLRRGRRLLLLPDPALVGTKGVLLLLNFLERYHIKPVDLIGLKEVETEKVPFEEGPFLETILKALKSEGKWFFVGNSLGMSH